MLTEERLDNYKPPKLQKCTDKLSRWMLLPPELGGRGGKIQRNSPFRIFYLDIPELSLIRSTMLKSGRSSSEVQMEFDLGK
jgi:hypothetical protein